MKTIFKNGTYERVSNEVGESQVKHFGYSFVSKSEWKKNVRDVNKADELPPVPVTVEPKEKKKPYQKPKKS